MLYRGGNTISLKAKVVETLVALVEGRGEVVSKIDLMNRLWAHSFVEESNLTQNIYLLRKTLRNRTNGQPFIENFSRRGYRFNGEIKTQVELSIPTGSETKTIVERETIESGHPIGMKEDGLTQFEPRKPPTRSLSKRQPWIISIVLILLAAMAGWSIQR